MASKRLLTAKDDIVMRQGRKFHEWLNGKVYEADWEDGSILLQSEHGVAVLNGVQKEDVYENFAFPEQ